MILTEVEGFSGQMYPMPARVAGWEVDDNDQRVDYRMQWVEHPLVGKLISNVSETGLWLLLMNNCSNFWEGRDGKDGKPQVAEFTVTLHCKEFRFVAETFKPGSEVLGYHLLGVYERSV